MIDITFRALGTDVRVIAPREQAEAARREILDYDARLSRFRPDSELCALNADPRPVVPASELLRDAVRAALTAAERSDGLVDPCLLDDLEAAGYRDSFDGGDPGPPDGPIRPARPHPARRWRAILVHAGAIGRPPGLRLDLGGSGKGHIADRVAAGLGDTYVLDAGGDIRVGGTHAIQVAHPLGSEPAAQLTVSDGAVATSSVVARAWRGANGRAHHLLDPSTGRPASTGLLSATAVARTTLEAETLAKTALLLGADGARRVLHDGVLVHADGSVETL